MAGPPPGFGAAQASPATGPPPGFGSGPPPGFGAPDQNAQNDVNKAAPAGFGPPDGQTQGGSVQKVVTRLASGVPLGRALKSAPELKPLARLEQDYRKRMDLVRAHPVEAFFDLLSGPQRAVGETVRQIENQQATGSHDLGQQLRAIGESVFMTSDPKKNEKIRERTTESVRAAIHAPTHQAIDEWTNKYVPAQVRPYAAAILKGGEDTGEQIISDPMTLVGAPLVKLAARTIHGAVTSKAMLAAAQATGVSHLFPHIQAMHTAYTNAAATLGKTAGGQFFRVRPDLDNVFTAEGKKLRMATENSEYATHAKRADLDKKAVAAGTAEDRFKQYINAHGNARTRAQLHTIDPAMAAHPSGAAAVTGSISKKSAIGNVSTALQDFRGSTPEEQLAWLNKMNGDVREGEIARRTQGLVQRYAPQTGAHPLLQGTQPVTNWRKVATESDDIFGQSQTGKIINGVTAPFRNLGKVAIFLNPLPHGLKNVGQLAYLAGGLHTVFHGVKAMLPEAAGGMTAATRSRLTKMGAMPGYTNHAIDTSVWSKVLPGWNTAAHSMQDLMGHIEEGWRAGLLETLDKKLGASKDIKDELMKGYIISDKIGDYRNQSAFVNLFSAIGGPFVAFRLGIVPKNVIAAVRDNPSRVLGVLRAQENTQHNRSEQAQKKNELEFGGPVGDLARMLPGGGAMGLEQPARFITSSSSLGLLGSVMQIAEHAKDQPISETLTNFATRDFPIAEPLAIAGHAIMGNAMPGQKESMTDRLMAATLESLATYFYKQQSDKARRLQASRERKQGI